MYIKVLKNIEYESGISEFGYCLKILMKVKILRADRKAKINICPQGILFCEK